MAAAARSTPNNRRTPDHPPGARRAPLRMVDLSHCRGARLCALCPPTTRSAITSHAVRPSRLTIRPTWDIMLAAGRQGRPVQRAWPFARRQKPSSIKWPAKKDGEREGVRVSDFRDRTVRCEDCRSTFVFTAGEQAFYEERGFSEPKRCPSCRAARKAGRAGSGHAASRPSEGRRERPARQMFAIVCDDCGQTAQVPFKPSGDRPVYCRDCYERHR